MPVDDAYATALTYRGLLSKTDASEDAEILLDLKAVSRYLDRKLNRFFTRDAAVVKRYYYPVGFAGVDPEAENPWLGANGSRELQVDDIATATGLVVKIDTDRDGLFTDETALGASDFELRPLNADKGPEPKPWTSLYLPTRTTTVGSKWPRGSMVEVEACFGWPAVPTAIERAVCHLTGILRIESPRSTASIAQGIDEQVDMSPDAQRIVAQLAKMYARRWIFA